MINQAKARINTIKSYLPEGPFLYPEDQLSDKGTRFMIQEIIREKVLTITFEEIPHSVAVVVDDIDESDKKSVKVFATIFVERDSQKSIIIGKDGEMIKKIGKMARKDIEGLLEKHIYLDLWVKVRKKWKKDPNALRDMGYTD